MDFALLGADFGAPWPIVIAITIIVVGLLFLRFMIKTAITLVKIAFLVAVGVGAYIGLSYLFGS